jgi:hypothetical protein
MLAAVVLGGCPGDDPLPKPNQPDQSGSELEAARLAYSTSVPAGYAAQKYVCYHDHCLALCQ